MGSAKWSKERVLRIAKRGCNSASGGHSSDTKYVLTLIERKETAPANPRESLQKYIFVILRVPRYNAVVLYSCTCIKIHIRW